MAAIALTTANTLRVVESIEQDTHPCNVDITIPALVKQTTNGKWVLAVAADTGTYFATHSAKAGQPLTGLKTGVVDGLNVSALAYSATIFSNATGVPDTATSTGALSVGEVIAAHSNITGTAADKLVRVSCP